TCAWLALARRVLRGGVRYADGRVRRAAHFEHTLRRRLTAR
ncbi:glycosyltransferase family 2 protein, partial [Micromonospora sp. 4G55]|nr:glycosyltransferase family 2 protein [Micromonospora sp. 4G55]